MKRDGSKRSRVAWLALAAILAIPAFHGEAVAQAACRTGGDCDSDGDGVPVEADGCPYTPAGARSIFNGCSTTDLVLRPEVLLDPIGEELRETATILRRDRSLHPVASRLDQSAVRLAQVDESLRAGKVCTGLQRYDKVVKVLQESERDLGRRLAKLEEKARRDLAPVPSFLAPGSLAADEGDHRELDQEILRLKRIGQIAGEAFASAFATRDSLQDACDAVVGRKSVTGVVADVDDTAGILHLVDGRKIAIGKSEPQRYVAPGIEVSIEGWEFDDGTLFGDITWSGASTTKPNLELSPFTCLDLMVVPFQPYVGRPVSQMTKLPLDGYRLIGTDLHALEFRMWLTAVPKDSPLCKSNLPLQWKRHSFEMFVRQEGEPPRLLAVDLSPGEIVSFPTQMKPGKEAKISVTARAQDCNLAGCNYGDLSGTGEIRVKVLNLGSYCLANYDRLDFALEDVDFEIGDSTPFPQFQPATVTGITSLFLQVDPNSTPIFQAEAYEIVNGQSSYPNVELISQGTPFAIYQNHDFVWDVMLFPFEMTGVRDAVGLRWPHVVGIRNGQFIQYHCSTPGKLVRDLIDYCPASPDSYYRLPFAGAGRVSQGNNGSFTHKGNQKYAFDFGFNGEVRAARGGTVTSVVESVPSSSNCYDASTTPQCQDSNNPPNGCAANMVTIRHQDGTEGQYFHMPQNGVLVNVGDRVRRGQKIALIGNTGCSSGTHLHFHSVTGPGSSQTVPIRFEQSGADCTIPPSNSAVSSNNPKY